MQYKILNHLILNNENIWKLLKYPESSALEKPNLTLQEKANLIYNGQPEPTDYRVFMIDYIDNSFSDYCSILRIFPSNINPENNIISTVTFAIQVFSHVQIQQLNDYSTRNVNLVQEILSTLNGSLIDGIGVLSFSNGNGRYNKAMLDISNNKNYTGYTITMSTNIA